MIELAGADRSWPSYISGRVTLTNAYLFIDLSEKIIIEANTKNGVKMNNIPIQVINMIKPPKRFIGLSYPLGSFLASTAS